MKRRTPTPSPSRPARPHRPTAKPGVVSGQPPRSAETVTMELMVIATVEAAGPNGQPGSGTVELLPVRIGYFRPKAGEVFVAGTFNNWDPRATPLKRDDLGDWSVVLQLPPGEYRYRLVVDGEWRDDPCAQQTARNSFGGFDAVVTV